MSYNKFIGMGNLVRDPELKYAPNGTPICNFTLAFNHRWRTEAGEQKEEVSFIDCVTFGKTAENLAQYQKKGGMILIDGRLKMEQWEDKQTQQKRSKIVVNVQTIQYTGGKTGEQQPKQEREAAPPQGKRETPRDKFDGPPQEHDDVPF